MSDFKTRNEIKDLANAKYSYHFPTINNMELCFKPTSIAIGTYIQIIFSAKYCSIVIVSFNF